MLNRAYSVIALLYFSQKQLPRKMKARLVIIQCAGYIFWQLFLWRLYKSLYTSTAFKGGLKWIYRCSGSTGVTAVTPASKWKFRILSTMTL